MCVRELCGIESFGYMGIFIIFYYDCCMRLSLCRMVIKFWIKYFKCYDLFVVLFLYWVFFLLSINVDMNGILMVVYSISIKII